MWRTGVESEREFLYDKFLRRRQFFLSFQLILQLAHFYLLHNNKTITKGEPFTVNAKKLSENSDAIFSCVLVIYRRCLAVYF